MIREVAVASCFGLASLALPSASYAATEIQFGTDGSWTTAGNPAVVPSSLPSSWAPAPAGSVWIAGANLRPAPGTVQTFIGTIDVWGIFAQSFSATWRADNFVSAIRLNDVVIYTLAGIGSNQFRDTDMIGSLSLNGAQLTALGASWINGSNFLAVDVTQGRAGGDSGFALAGTGPAVPEPGTWMLMILGLGAVGFAMRRRQLASVRLQFA